MSVLGWHAPETPLRESVLRAIALGLAGVIAIAWVARPPLQLGVLYAAKAAVVFGTTMMIAFGFVGDHHPFLRFGPANHVTMIRAMLVALIAGLIGEPTTPRVAGAASGAAVIMTVLDGVDGFLARRSRMASIFGARFDMETDAVFVMAMSILVWQHTKTGPWILLGGMMRYAFILAGSWLPWMARPLRPTRRARVISACHMAGLSVALAPVVPPPLSAIVVASTLAALTWSFAADVRRLWRLE
ncbi:MAG TPA: CDP-alcohol phosphatidyltransferase family protein [Vicinamibacterales bacterium]|jgi:phosphatidylglycerophosphate synthase|nr:CDP-alcohol phosphatidyltransferase family protein [Vicinamibacterales bacterium]